MFELLERDVGGRRRRVEVEAVVVFRLLVGRVGELLFSIVGNIATLGIGAVVFLSKHPGVEKRCGTTVWFCI